MEARVIEFANVLRRNGIRVSLSENMDAFRALGLLGIADPLLFRNALRTTLVKRTGDVKPFEELFDYFFLGIGQALDALDRKSWTSSVSRRNNFRRCSNRSKSC